MTFAHATLALALAPAVLFALARAARSTPRTPRARLAFALLALTLALTLAAVSAPELRTSISGTTVLLLLDRSRSTELAPDLVPRLRALLDEAPRSMGPRDRLGVLSFARTAETTQPAAPRAYVTSLALPPAPADRDASDLAHALQHALGALPSDGPARIVLVSDGDETTGDALSSALACAASGVPVDVVALERPARADVAAVRLRAPDRVGRDETAELTLVTRSTTASRVRVELARDGVVVDRVERTLNAGEDAVPLRDAQPPRPTPGLTRYEARVIPLASRDDAIAGNETSAAFVQVEGSARALVLTPYPAAAVRDPLVSAGFTVEVRPPEGAPRTTAEFAAYDLVVLSDARARALPEGSEESLRDAVRALGTGLWMLGSDESFGPGGYAASPVAEVLPVRLDLRRDRERATVTLAVVIDRSGSMSAPVPGGRTKLELANEAAARSAELLGPVDTVAILHVDTVTQWTLRPRTADDPRAIARAAHQATVGGGGIYTDLALRDAYAAVRASHTTIRHVLLLADGGDAERLEPCHALALAAAREHITTSVVAIGTGSDVPGLMQLAREGGGRFYLTEDARTLPRIFTEDTVVSARSAIREERFVPQRSRSADLLRDIAWSAAPALSGYVVTEAQPGAEVLLTALDGDPLLARRQEGLGRSAVFTSDLRGRWSSAWLAWPGSGTLTAQTAAWLARGARLGSSDSARVTVTAARGRVRVSVDATTADGAWDTSSELVARVTGPDAADGDPRGARELTLEARGAGRYEVELDAPRPGSYLAAVGRRDGALVGLGGVEVSEGAELSMAGPASNGRALLEALAARSGGLVRSSFAQLFRTPSPPRGQPTRDLTEPLTLAALASLLATVAARRMPWPAGLAGALRAALTRRTLASPAIPPPTASDAALERVRALRAKPAASPADSSAPPVPIASARSPADSSASPPPARSPADSSAPPTTATSLDELVARRRKRP